MAQIRLLRRIRIVAMVGCLLFQSFAATAEEPDYMPVGEGAEWVMDLQMVSPDGKIEKGIGRRKIGEKVQKDGHTYFRERTVVQSSAPFSYSKLVRKDGEGFYSIVEGAPTANEQREMVLPLKVGATWKTSYGRFDLTYTVVSKGNVTIDGKTYEDCLHLRVVATDGSYTEEVWEAPDIGPIKSEISYKDGRKLILTLRKFTPPGQKGTESHRTGD